MLKLYLGLYLAQSLVIAEEYLDAVSPFSNEEYSKSALKYLNFPIEEDHQTRDKICRTITKSSFIRNIFHVHPIKSKYSEIFWETSSIKLPANITGPYKPRKILIGKNIFHEAVFLCLAWNHDAGNFTEFFISRRLNFDLSKNQVSSTPFRVIFEEDGKGKLVTIAIAEQPLKVWNAHLDDKLAGKLDDASDQDFCNLTRNMKFRLCTLLINSKMYRSNFTFSSYTNNEEPLCEEAYAYYLSDIRIGRLWTVKCKAEKIRRVGFDTGIMTYFHILKGHESHSYFIGQGHGLLMFNINVT